MVKKRIAGVITVNNGLAIQSFGYKRYLPVGNPIHLAENLSRWGADEIIVLDIKRSMQNLGPNLELLNQISRSKINTPLIYGGGITSVDQAAKVISVGAERIILDNLLHNDIDTVYKISNFLGSQAVIGSFPLSLDRNGSISWYNYINKIEKKLNESIIEILRKRIISEVLIIDRDNEGITGSFDLSLIEKFPVKIPIIAFGGLSIKKKLGEIIDNPFIVSAAIGNPLNYTEHSIQKIKLQLLKKPIRGAYYLKDRL